MHERPSARDPVPTPTEGSAEPLARPERLAAFVAHELLNIVLSMRLRLDVLEARSSAGSPSSVDSSPAHVAATTRDLAALRAAVDRLAGLAHSIRAPAPPPHAPPASPPAGRAE